VGPGVGYHVIGRPDQTARRGAYAAADIFMSLADNIQETFGLTPVEAMAAGLPVIVSDWNGYRDTVRHGAEGFLIPTIAPPPGSGVVLAQRYAAGSVDYDHFIGKAAQFVALDQGACLASELQAIKDGGRRRQLRVVAR